MGLVWSPSGDEVWFTGARAKVAALRAVSLNGRERLLAEGTDMLRIQDLFRDGRALAIGITDGKGSGVSCAGRKHGPRFELVRRLVARSIVPGWPHGCFRRSSWWRRTEARHLSPENGWLGGRTPRGWLSRRSLARWPVGARAADRRCTQLGAAAGRDRSANSAAPWETCRGVRGEFHARRKGRCVWGTGARPREPDLRAGCEGRSTATHFAGRRSHQRPRQSRRPVRPGGRRVASTCLWH